LTDVQDTGGNLRTGKVRHIRFHHHSRDVKSHENAIRYSVKNDTSDFPGYSRVPETFRYPGQNLGTRLKNKTKKRFLFLVFRVYFILLFFLKFKAYFN